MITNDARCTWKIKFSFAMVKAALNKKITLFTNELILKLRKQRLK
jgi:hypothetical protein